MSQAGCIMIFLLDSTLSRCLLTSKLPEGASLLLMLSCPAWVCHTLCSEYGVLMYSEFPVPKKLQQCWLSWDIKARL